MLSKKMKIIGIAVLLLLSSLHSVLAYDESSDTMFNIEITTANVLLLALLIGVSGWLILTRRFGLVIAGGLILILISTMIMFSFNPYIGLMLLLATIGIIFEVMKE